MSDQYFLHDIKNHIHNLSLFFKTRLKNKSAITLDELILLDNEANCVLEILEEEQSDINCEEKLYKETSFEFLDETLNHFLEMNNITTSYDQRSEINIRNILGTKAVIIRCIENICRNIQLHSKDQNLENIKYIESDQYLILELSSIVGNCKTNIIGRANGLKSISKMLKSYDSYIFSELRTNVWMTRIYFKKTDSVYHYNLKAA